MYIFELKYLSWYISKHYNDWILIKVLIDIEAYIYELNSSIIYCNNWTKHNHFDQDYHQNSPKKKPQIWMNTIGNKYA